MQNLLNAVDTYVHSSLHRGSAAPPVRERIHSFRVWELCPRVNYLSGPPLALMPSCPVLKDSPDVCLDTSLLAFLDTSINGNVDSLVGGCFLRVEILD